MFKIIRTLHTNALVSARSHSYAVSILLTLFFLAGVAGHGPWKQDEPYIFGIVQHFISTNTWLIPVNAGMPFMEKPPLFYWTAVVSTWIFGCMLEPADSARMASVFYTIVTTGFMWKLCAALFAQHKRRIELQSTAVLLLLGTFGLVRFAHEMTTDIALLATSTIALYGMALLLCKPQHYRRAGGWIGLGTGTAFLAKGILMPCILGASGVFLLLATPSLDKRKTAIAAAIAFLCASPFLFIWPVLVYLHSPALFTEFFWQNNIGRFFGFSVARLGANNEFLYFFKVTPFFAFPAFPLALVAAARCRDTWRTPAFLLPATVASVGFATLLVSASGRAQYLLPLLPAFALLGAQAVVDMPQKGIRMCNAIIRITASLVIAGVWVLWLGLLNPSLGALSPYTALFGKWLPLGFMPPELSAPAFLFAVAATGIWIWALQQKTESIPDTAFVWLAAMTAIWGTVFTLVMPWIDVTRSYDEVFTRMENSMTAPGCIAMHPSVGESIAPLLEYYEGHPLPYMGFDDRECPFILTVTPREMPGPAGTEWKMIWQGTRMLDSKDEQLRLYQHSN